MKTNKNNSKTYPKSYSFSLMGNQGKDHFLNFQAIMDVVLNDTYNATKIHSWEEMEQQIGKN